jgi:hypothetical protein
MALGHGTAMNNQNRVKEGLRTVPLTNGVLADGLKKLLIGLEFGLGGRAPERARRREKLGCDPAV